ncbi:MAG TPA: DNA polymerase III subunit [Gemmatimonadaceae bacterium]|nr:DNA polymerase III subunit [Gemmatimonadaceae bacterium]
MAIIDIFGHESLRQRLAASLRAKTLPASLLFHGPRGVGKQRLALWVAQSLLCTGEDPPCEKCLSCRYVRELTHPDLHWVFPRPRLKDSDPDLEQVRDDYGEATAERAGMGGLYPPPSGSEGIYVATVRSLVQRASMSPAMGNRKVFIVGDAERMVPQEGADMAANAFLKLLEEPPADTTIILTSSEPGALLPTIRSRVAAVRVPPVADAGMKAFLSNPAVKAALDKNRRGTEAERLRVAAGAPGRLFSGESDARATLAARRIIDAATGEKRSQRYAAALAQGSASARGAFSDTLDALVELLGERTRDAVHRQDDRAAAAASKAVDAVLLAQTRTITNVSPQLIATRLIRDLSATLR